MCVEAKGCACCCVQRLGGEVPGHLQLPPTPAQRGSPPPRARGWGEGAWRGSGCRDVGQARPTLSPAARALCAGRSSGSAPQGGRGHPDLSWTGGAGPARLPYPLDGPHSGTRHTHRHHWCERPATPGPKPNFEGSWDLGDSVNSASEGQKHFVFESFNFPESFWEMGGWGPASPFPGPVPTGLLECRLVLRLAFSQFICCPLPNPKWAKTTGPAQK